MRTGWHAAMHTRLSSYPNLFRVRFPSTIVYSESNGTQSIVIFGALFLTHSPVKRSNTKGCVVLHILATSESARSYTNRENMRNRKNCLLLLFFPLGISRRCVYIQYDTYRHLCYVSLRLEHWRRFSFENFLSFIFSKLCLSVYACDIDPNGPSYIGF